MADNLRPQVTVSTSVRRVAGMGMFAGENYARGEKLEKDQRPCTATWLEAAVRFA